MNGTARRHHFVSAFLLAGFTLTGHKEDEFWVTDFETGRQFRCTPETTGFQRDFHTFDIENVAPDYLETEILAKIEDRCAPIIKNAITSRKMPTGRAFHDLMYFLSLMIVKTPKARRVAERGVDWLNKLMVRQEVNTEEQWTALQLEMRQAGIEMDERVTYEQIKSFMDRDRFTFKADQSWILAATMAGAEAVLPSLLAREWSVLLNPRFLARRDDSHAAFRS